MKNIILSLLVVSVILPSCYKDLGNYTYKEINELTIEGIEDDYARDLEDSLVISPKIVGTQYSDTSKFDIKWTIDGKILSTDIELRTIVNAAPGRRAGALTLRDRETQVQTTKNFTLNVGSSTAGDLYMILSKSRGKAELSYLRLDKPSNFAVNYFEERFGFPLGTNPQQLCMIDAKASNSFAYPFTGKQGRIIALIDNKALLFDKHTLELDSITSHITLDDYTGLVSYPPVTVEGYQSQFLLSAISMWRITTAGGSPQEGFQFAEISNGTFYRVNYAGNAPSTTTKRYNLKPTYENAYLSPFCFYDEISDEPAGKYYWQGGNVLGNILVFDKVSGRFGRAYDQIVFSIELEHLKAFQGHDLLWGSHTSDPALSMAVLTSGNSVRMILLTKAKDVGTRIKYTLSGEIIVPENIINPSTKFAMLKRSPDLFFGTGNKLYSYNTLEMINNRTPSQKDLKIDLTQLGYDQNAVITNVVISRSQRTLLLGVSRYGNNDPEAMSEENKGDLVVLNLSSSLNVTLREIHRGVCGIPVDVQIKYQSHYRDGKNIDGSFIDLI